MKIAIISDNKSLCDGFISIIKNKDYDQYKFDFFSSYYSNFKLDNYNIKRIDVKKEYKELISKYNLIISIHCKQLFPKELVTQVRCINVHPGFNPYNRGWYPQVFSIINKKPIGATIHLIDDKIDHGGIIVQEGVAIDAWDTSIDVYNKVLQLELALLKSNLKNIIDENYLVQESEEGNLNLKSDFNKLCELDLDHKGSLGEHIDLLRALTHGDYKNAYFRSGEEKIYISINMEKAK